MVVSQPNDRQSIGLTTRHIFDVVFHFNAIEYKEKINEWILGLEKQAGRELKEVEVYIKNEYSTFKWILDGMIGKAGFRIIKCRSDDGFLTEYHCKKIKGIGTKNQFDSCGLFRQKRRLPDELN